MEFQEAHLQLDGEFHHWHAYCNVSAGSIPGENPLSNPISSVLLGVGAISSGIYKNMLTYDR